GGRVIDRVVIGTLEGAPVGTAPTSATVDENGALAVNVSASDPDGDAIASLTAAGLPAGASFTAASGNTSGSLLWTPTFADAGAYTVVFKAANAMSDSATTAVTVRNLDRAPAVTAPVTARGVESSALTFAVSASDPDGQGIASLVAAGLPSGATFTANASRTGGTFTWTPAAGQRGTYHASFTAANALAGSAATTIEAQAVGAPVVTAPATASVKVGSVLTVNVSAFDPDLERIDRFGPVTMPSGAFFTAGTRNTTGSLT